MTFWLLYLSFYFLQVSAQAPNDVSQYCRDNALVPDYPEIVKPLMDSWSYQYLLGEDGVWQSLNLDSHPEKWLSFQNGTNSPCAKLVGVEEPTSLPQDNWLVTQHINKSIDEASDRFPTLVYINLTYTITSCQKCNDAIQLLLYFTDSIQSDISNKTDQFTVIANLTGDEGQHVESQLFVIKPEQDGFYLALRDYGSNVTVSRFLVYRLIGPAKQLGLTLFPETPAPTLNCTTVSGVCVANANTTTGHLPVLNLDPDGSWTHSEDQCYCIEGHELVTLEGLDQCQACPLSKYKFAKDNSECLNCPMNSVSTVHGSSVCTCTDQYYRAPSETPDDRCTQPPSAPLNLRALSVTNTSVILQWDKPTSDGGRNDTYYDAFGSAENVNYTQFNTEPVYDITFEMTGLKPNRLYQVTVVAENGVSMQAGEEHLRSAGAFVRTAKGVSPKIIGVYVRDNDNTVVWLPSSNENGEIIGYQIQLYSTEDAGDIIDVSSSLTYYQVNITDDLPISGQPVKVRVRGLTSVGAGPWSDAVIFAAVNPLAPTSTTSSTTTSSSSTAVNSNSVTITSNSDTITSSKSVSMSDTESKSMSTSSSKGSSKTASSSATPTEKSPGESSTNPIVAIVAVVGGAIFILVLVGVGAIVYYVFRKIRLNRMKRKEEIDYAPLVHYNPTRDDEEITVKLKD